MNYFIDTQNEKNAPKLEKMGEIQVPQSHD